VRNCIDGFTHVHAAGLGSVIDGNSINDGFEVALLVNGSTEGTAAGIVEAIAFELVDDVTFEFVGEITLVATAVGAEIAPAFDVVCTGNAAGSLGLGASSAHDTSAPKNNQPRVHYTRLKVDCAYLRY
jgi:hypothetical protein